MIYIDKTDDMSVFEVNDTTEGVEVRYSDIGQWTEWTKNTRAISVTQTDDDLMHLVTKEDRDGVRFNVGELIQLYFALDFMYKHSKHDSVNGKNKVNMLKFEKVQG